MRLFKNLTYSFREDFLGISLCSYNQVAPIHHSHVHGPVKISLSSFEKGRSRNISVNWELEAIYSVVITCTCINFFTKSIQIIQRNIAYFHNQGKYSVFVKVVLKGDN